MKVTNSKCRQYVQRSEPFEGSNLYAVRKGVLYIVYSYGEHFPLFVRDSFLNTWYENEDKYSHSTSVHRSKAHPQCNTNLQSTQFLINLIKNTSSSVTL